MKSVSELGSGKNPPIFLISENTDASVVIIIIKSTIWRGVHFATSTSAKPFKIYATKVH